jgi:uncharacterized protein
MKISADEARRFLVTRQLLAPARSLKGGEEAVLEVLRRLGSLQFDPLSIAGRNHDLVLHARVAKYDPAWCDALYERRVLYEAFNKGLSLILAEDYPWFRGRLSKASQTILDDHRDVADQVFARIRAEGPLSSLDFERKTGSLTDWFGAPTNVVRAVLEAATVTGVLGLARREGNRRFYDLSERLLPRKVLNKEIPIRDQLRYRMLSRYRAHGLLGASGGGDIFSGLGYAKPVHGHPGRNVLRDELVERGDIVAVAVDGVGKRFVIREEVELLEQAPEVPPSVSFLPPFDALVWDRKLLASLFGFDYVWELFHPPEKRRWGWYVLPMLFGDRFVGRIEPRIDRDAGCVEMIGLWWEDGFTPKRADGFVDAFRDALHASQA